MILTFFFFSVQHMVFTGEISLVPLQKLNFPYLNNVHSIWQIHCFIKLLKDTDKAHNYES